MRAVRYHEQGEPEVLQVDEIEVPSPGPGEVLVEVRAAGVNPVDTYLRSVNEEYVQDSLPAIPGADFAGVVDEVGPAVAGYDIGDRVFGVMGKSQGGYAEYIAAPIKNIAILPDGVDFEQGAGIGNAGGTGWHALIDRSPLEPGHTCLVHGGSGGLGHVVTQVAATAGATVIATAGSEDRCDRLGEFGVDVALDYNRPDLQEAITEAAPEGVDVVLDHFPHLYFDLDIGVCGTGGTVVIYDKFEIDSNAVHEARGKDITVRFTSFGNTVKGDVLHRIGRLLATGDVRVEIAGRYSLDEAANAHHDVIEGGYVGRLMIIP